jgi:hypothetical protein
MLLREDVEQISVETQLAAEQAFMKVSWDQADHTAKRLIGNVIAGFRGKEKIEKLAQQELPDRDD